jgi:alpha-glucosidase
MSALNPRTRRFHGLEGVGALASMPLDPSTASVGFSTATLEGARLTAAHVSPATSNVPREGREPVFAIPPDHLPRLARAEPDPRVAAEHDGTTLRVQVRTGPGVAWFGAGLAAGRLRRDGRALTFWNTDAWRHGETSPSLYPSHPVALAILPGGTALAVVADSAARGTVAFATDGLEYAFEDDFLRVVLLEGAAEEVLRALAALCGRVERPPRWALGYHQCRWGYTTADEVLQVAREFRAREIPCDAVWLDIDHMDRHRVFTWDPVRFPAPRELLGALHAQGLRAVAITDPGVAAASDNPLLDGAPYTHFVQDARGAHAKGRVWPGVCLFPDFTRPETRLWWAEHARAFVAASGLDGLWCDMNEPSVFRSTARTLPDDARHAAGLHARVHNLYGHLMVQATRDGLARARPDARPFLLTRAAHLATAALAATWTGDNQATWEDLAWSIPMVLSLGLCGQPFSGPDVGGFDGDPDPELFARWFELAAYLPFCRGHSERGACRKEPWAFGPEVEARVRAALERRMALVPHLETLFEECARTGLPVARPVWLADPADARLLDVDDAFLLGSDLLVAPAVRPSASERDVLLPAARGGWYAFPQGGAPLLGASARVAAPPGTTPVLARAGTALVTAAPAQHAARVGAAPRTLHAFLDPGGSARGRSYEDEGDGHAWRSGGFRAVEWHVHAAGTRLEVEARVTGAWTPPARRWSLRVHFADGRGFARDDLGDPSAGLGFSLRG